MSYYVIIRGPLGIGKSTIAKELAKLLGADYISIDDVLAEHKLDKVSEKEKCIPVKNFVEANELVIPKVEKEIEKGKIVVFDGNFYHKEQIEHLIRKLNFEHYEFTLKAPLKTCIERDSQRQRVYGKDAATAVYKAVSRFDYGTSINTEKKTAEQVVKEILSHLPT